MAIETIFLDGFDSYSGTFSHEVSTGPWESTSNIVLNNSAGRESGGCLRANQNTSTSYAVRNFAPSLRTAVVGFAFYVDHIGDVAATSPLYLQSSDLTTQISLVLGTDGIFRIYRGNSAGTLLASGTTVFTPTSWYYLELRVYIDDTNGEVEFRIDGNSEIALTTSLDTQASASFNSISRINLNTQDYSSNSFSGDNKFDDLYVRGDSSANTAGGFLGDVRIISLRPNSNGSNRDFTLSTGTDDFAVLDESPVSTSDYAYASTSGDKISCGFPTVPAGASIKSVNAVAHTKVGSGGAGEVKFICKSGATTASGSAKRVLDNRWLKEEVYDTDPNTGSDWTESAINAAEFGIEIV